MMTETTELKASDGSSVAIREDDVLETRDSRGRLLFEYDPATGRAVVHVAGELELAAGRKITLRSPEIHLIAGKFEQTVGRLFLWAQSAYERIEGLWHARAGRVRTEAESSYLLQTKRANLVSKGDLRLQGESINLG